MIIDLAQARKVLELTLAEYSKVRATYWAEIYDVVYEYLVSGASITSFKSRMKRAMVTAFPKVGDLAWEDGGADLPLDKDTNAILTSRMNAELGFIDNTFEALKLARKSAENEGDLKDIAIQQAFARADGYAQTLDGVYNQIKAMAAGSKMLTLVGEDGTPPNFPCTECRKYKGQRHKASWWVGRGLIPYPGNPNYTCKNYKCQHVLVDDNGALFTI